MGKTRSDAGRRPGRLVPLVSGCLTAALVIAVVAIAYGSQAPTLGVAELAPVARRALEAPPSTANDNSAAGRASSGRRPTTTTTPPSTSNADAGSGSTVATTPTTRVGRARPCYGNPPRQIEDPMAPPCIATIFEGDNGGATARGVTSTEIRIGIPGPGISPTHSFGKTAIALIDYLNQNFEFYGRRLVPVLVSGEVITATQARATAAQVAAQGVFGAVTAYGEWQAGQSALPAELARQGLVTVTRNASTWWTDRTLFDPLHPYVWSVYPSSEDLQANIADLSCQTLAGHPAAGAGDAALRDKTRQFAIVAVGAENAPATSKLAQTLSDCTGRAPTVASFNSTTWDANARAAFERLRADGTTTVLCICEAWFTSSAYSPAHQAGYHPEWVIVGGYSGTGYDESWIRSARASGQIGAPIRLSATSRLLPLQARPWFAPLMARLTAGSTAPDVSSAEALYNALLVLASGIQAAGPALTAETFAAGLMTTQFPNPGAGAPPYWQPSAGFGAGDHSFFDDYNVGWWSDQAEGLDVGIGTQAAGSWCYLHQAARFRPGTYPADGSSLLFNPNVPCR